MEESEKDTERETQKEREGGKEREGEGERERWKLLAYTNCDVGDTKPKQAMGRRSASAAGSTRKGGAS